MPLEDHELPSHLAPLVPSEWAIWRWFVLRGAGFPANLAVCLSAPGCALAADALVSAEMQTENHFQTGIRTLNKVLDRFTAEGMNPQDSKFRAVMNARRRMAGRKVPQDSELLADFSGIFHEIAESVKHRERLRAGFEIAFSECLEHQSGVLRNFASDPRFQEAIIWQNWHAFDTGIEPIAHMPENSGRNQRQREREELVASYVQRYCLKNDTIGFFGPVAWGRIESGEKMIEAVPGSSLLRQRHTYFENWPIERLAANLSLMEGMDWWIPPRLDPFLLVQEGMLHRPDVPPVPLSALEQVVLPLCNGENFPADILAAVQRQFPSHGIGRAELHALLRGKASEGILRWRFALPVEANTEISLRRQLLQVGDEQLQHTAITCLDRLEAARQAVADATGKPAQLCEAMRKLERTFEEITRLPGSRNPGTTYGGRTLVYEDCQRDLTFRITPELLAPVAPALSLLCRGLRWLMQSMALEFHRLFCQTYEELAAASSNRDISLLKWWLYTEPKLIGAPSISALEDKFRQKWSSILPLQQDTSSLQFNSHELQERVEGLFPDLGGGFYPVRYFCPDMMLAATDVEAIRRGEVLYVMGEVHAGKNTLVHVCLIEQHPNRQELVEATQWDLWPFCFKIVAPQEGDKTVVRPSEGLFRPTDYLLATTPDTIPPTGFAAHPMSALLIQEQDGELMVIDPASSGRFRILEAFADLLFAFVTNKTSWGLPMPHAPRVLIDNLVVQRETWRARVDELVFATEKTEAQRFLGARSWMKSRAVPQKMFVRSPMEAKPFYLDLASPVLVEILSRMVRRVIASGRMADEFVFSEMLPDIEHAWLHAASGAKYTSELRFAVVDLKARSYSEQFKTQALKQHG